MYGYSRYLLFIIIILFSSCITKSKYNYKISTQFHSPEDLRKDIDFVFKNLEKKHPGINWYITPENLNFKIDSLKTVINEPLNTKDFYLKLAPIIASIKCGHTKLLIPSIRKSDQYSIERIGNERILKNYSFIVKNDKLFFKGFKIVDTLIKSGDEILAINNIPTSEIIKNLNSYISADGYNMTYKYSILNRNFSYWYYLIYSEKDSLLLDISNGKEIKNILIRKSDLVAKNYLKNSSETKNQIVNTQTFKYLKYKGLDENNQYLLDYKLLDSNFRIGYLKVKSFSFKHSNFDKFFDETFKEIKASEIKNLILDLRDNGGGNLNDSRKLFSYLTATNFKYLSTVEAKGRFIFIDDNLKSKLSIPFQWIYNQLFINKKEDRYLVKIKELNISKPNKNNFKGNLYIITNGLSFSAATLLAANLKGINRGIFVGSEGGGGFNKISAGIIPTLTLPYSGLKLKFGLYKIVPNAQSEYDGRSIIPDIYVEHSLEDDIIKKDPEIETILKLIKN